MQSLKIVLCFALAATLFAGCALFHKKPKADETTVYLYEQADSALPAENQQTVEIPHTDLKLTISPFPTLTEKDVQSAQLYDTAGGKAIYLRFDAHGTILLDEMTTRLRGQYVAVLINRRPVSAWLVNQRIINGQFLIEGDFTDEEAKKVVDDLNQLSKKNNSK
jgi:preprotein translocase subunit SecD